MGSATLSVQLFGGVSAAWSGRHIEIQGRGAQALLALLATDRRVRTRQAIGTDLWPDAGRRSAIWLRQALWLLRRALAAAGADPNWLLVCDFDRIGFRSGLDLHVDAVQFANLLAGRPPDLEAALALYRGDYAEGLEQECFVQERERLADLYEDALAQLARRCLHDGDMACARTASLRLVARDPLREDAHATLIEVYGRAGSRDQVIRQYRRLVRLLDQELGIQPLAETQASFRAALRRTGIRSVQAVLRRT